MSPEVFEKWEHIVSGVDKTNIPVEFIKKLIIKLDGRRQKTINIQGLIKQGFDVQEIEEAVSRKLQEYDDEMVCIEFVLDIQGIADTVQPETDKMLKNL
jgi:acid phosphatase class B